MSTKIDNDSMAVEIDGRVIATAEFREHAAADGCGAWIVSCHPGRLFTRNQAITAMVLAERLAAGFGDDDLFVVGCTGRGARPGEAEPERWHQVVPPLVQEAPPELTAAPTLEQTIRARHESGHSQRAIARELNIDRRKVKRILDRAA